MVPRLAVPLLCVPLLAAACASSAPSASSRAAAPGVTAQSPTASDDAAPASTRGAAPAGTASGAGSAAGRAASATTAGSTGATGTSTGVRAGGPATATAPGSYAIDSQGSSQFGTATPESHSGSATLVVDAPAGGLQGEAIHPDSGSGGLTLQDALDGRGGFSLASVTSQSSKSPCTEPVTLSFSPPLALDPTPLREGATYDGTVTGRFQGTWHSSVGAAGSDDVGGQAVAVRHVDATVTITSGSVCGVSVTGSVTIGADVDPADLLVPVLTTTFDFSTPVGHLHATDTDRLRSIHPS